MTKISVIIPVYNIAAHLQQCLDSVVGQTFSDIEIICVDDGSTDESPKILTNYAARDNRFQILTQENAGPGAARNAGLARAKGEYVIFLDSDDWFEADFLEQMFKQMRKTDADITICRAVEFDSRTGREISSEWMLKKEYLPSKIIFSPEEISQYLFQFTYGMAWDKLYRREFLQKTGLRYPLLRNSEDLAFVFPSLLAAKSISIIDKVLIHHRICRFSSVSNTRSNQPEAAYEAFSIVKTYLERHDLMEQYQQSFMNWAMEFLVWNVANLDDQKAQKQYFQELKHRWLPQMNFDIYPRSYYRDSFTYAKYWLIKCFPYSIFCIALIGYRTLKYVLDHK